MPKNEKRKYIVFETLLLKLFLICQICRRNAIPHILNFVGTAVGIQQVCSDASCPGYTWWSQPMFNRMALGNLLLSAAILFSGSTVSKTLRMLDILGVKVYHVSSFYRHQKKYLHGSIKKYWDTQQARILAGVSADIIIGGDARCDSPGHTAKYGSYTFLDLKSNRILAMELVQVRWFYK